MEVALPAGFNMALAGRGKGRSTADWAAMGVRAAAGGNLPGGTASVLAPAGTGGPGFLVFRNFNVILRYNNAENYALGVGHLADRLAGGSAIRGSFPPDASGMRKADLCRLLGVAQAQGDRLLDFLHTSKMEQLETALLALGIGYGF